MTKTTMNALWMDLKTALQAHGFTLAGNVLTLQTPLMPGVKLRLTAAPGAPAYAHSANFAIAYTAESITPTDEAALKKLVTLLQQLDPQPIPDAQRQFLEAIRPDLPAELQPKTSPDQWGIQSVVIVGGGTAGYLTALYLQRQFPELKLTLVESSRIPIIGVGEATTTLMPSFLHHQLGIDVVDLYREVRPTWKMGICFDWGLPGNYDFRYEFGDCDPVEAFAQEGDLRHSSATSRLMALNRSPLIRGQNGEIQSLLAEMPHAYHLSNAPFVRFLAKTALARGIVHLDAEIVDTVRTSSGERMEHLVLDGGRTLTADLFVDATGFRSVLLEKAMGSPFQSYASTLFCDSALVGQVPQEGPIQPYTTAQTMDSGWCWRIPVEGEDHRGYVFSSAHTDLEQAREEMTRKNPGLHNTWSLKFRSGRHADFWKGNVVAVGNAYGFVEPLESTALHMVILETLAIAHVMQQGPEVIPLVNSRIGAHWDYLRWFLGVHYRFNHKLDTPFWRDVRENVNISGMEEVLARYAREGPTDSVLRAAGSGLDPTFGPTGLATLLLGQKVPFSAKLQANWPPDQWQARVAQMEARAQAGLTQAESLAYLREHPEVLQTAVHAAKSWMRSPRYADVRFWHAIPDPGGET